jgi:hypothetical protein
MEGLLLSLSPITIHILCLSPGGWEGQAQIGGGTCLVHKHCAEVTNDVDDTCTAPSGPMRSNIFISRTPFPPSLYFFLSLHPPFGQARARVCVCMHMGKKRAGALPSGPKQNSQDRASGRAVRCTVYGWQGKRHRDVSRK